MTTDNHDTPTNDPHPAAADELIERLCLPDRAVVVGGPDPSLENFKDQLERDYPFVKFVTTRGGTDIGFPLDRAASNLDGADFEHGTGGVHLEGHLVLNFIPVRLIADIDLATLSGRGQVHRCPA